MRNLRLIISYDGTDFHGWQRQPNLLTVQECLELAIERVLGEKAPVFGSGRTDAGVHALNQVANFHTDCRIPCQNLVKALNDSLPPTVRIKDAREVPAQFHARYAACSKTYRYRILQSPVCSPFLWRFVWHYPLPLDLERMAVGAEYFVGEHDFSSFAVAEGSHEDLSVQADAGAGTSSPACGHDPEEATPVRGRVLEGRRTEPGTVRKILASRMLRRERTAMFIYEVTGTGFLHHMVRNMVGTLVEVGRGKLDPGDINRILVARNRAAAGPKAPPQGLCLVGVEY